MAMGPRVQTYNIERREGIFTAKDIPQVSVLIHKARTIGDSEPDSFVEKSVP